MRCQGGSLTDVKFGRFPNDTLANMAVKGLNIPVLLLLFFLLQAVVTDELITSLLPQLYTFAFYVYCRV